MWWRREKKDVTEFLYNLLVAEAPRKGYARTVAERMEVPYPTLSKYWLGKRRFPAALVKPLFVATDYDPRVADFFLTGGSEYRLARREDAAGAGDVGRAVIALARLQGTVSERYLEAIDSAAEKAAAAGADSALAAAEAEKMAQAVRALIRQAEELRASLEAMGREG